MSRPLFEQYKDALRRGHLAARAGRVDEALAAYGDAARLAPDRAAPHTSAATALHRAGRDGDSLAAFERALAISGDDEATLRARAVVYRDLGRLASAAADLEHVAEALDADGRVPEALAAAREAVALTATPGRRALVERLEHSEAEAVPRARPALVPKPAPSATPIPRPAPAKTQQVEAAAPVATVESRMAAAPPAEPPASRAAPTEVASHEPEAVAAPEAAPSPPSQPSLMELYDAPIEPEDTASAGVQGDGSPDVAAGAPAAVAAAAASPSSPSLMDLYDAPIEPEDAESAAMDAAAAALAARVAAIDEPGPATVVDEPARPLVPELAALNAEPVGRVNLDAYADPGSAALVQLEEDDASAAIPWPAIDLPSAPPPPIVGPPPDPETLVANALELIDAGDPKGARDLLLTAVAVHRAAGRPDAALDVCLQLLALVPGDPHVHLAIAGLQLDHGWRVLATEKIQLLLRLTALTGDTQAEADAHALAAERLRDEATSSFARA